MTAVLLTVVLIASVVIYFVYYKPFGPAFVQGLALAVLRLGVAAAIVVLGGALGRRILPAPDQPPLSAAVLQAALGLGILSVGVLVVGRLGLLNLPMLLGALLVTLLALRNPARGWLGSVLGQVVAAVRAAHGFERAVAWLAGLVLAATLVEALAPPAHFDALVYHLLLPKEFLAESRVQVLELNPYSGMPLALEMLYSWAMGLAGAPAAAVLGWMIGGLALAGTYSLGRKLGSGAAWGAVAALLAGFTISGSLGWAYVDWGTALYGIAVLLALPIDRSEARTTDWVLAGLMAGLAIGVKYTAGIAVVAGAAAVVTFAGAVRQRASALAAFGLAAIVAAAPWLLRNLLDTGTPLYPYFGASAAIDPIRQEFFRGGPPELPAGLVLLVPVWASLIGVEGGGPFDASIGPLLIGLLPGLLVVGREMRRQARPLLAFVAAGWLVWIVGARTSNQLVQPRLYYALYPGWAALAGVGFTGFVDLRRRSPRLSTLAKAVVILTVSLTVLGLLVNAAQTRPLEVVLGLEGPEPYLERRLGAFAWAMQRIETPGSRERSLLLWEPRGFYCRPDCLPDTWIDRWYWLRSQGKTSPQIIDGWRSEGITLLLLYRDGMAFVREHDERYRAQDWTALEELLSRLTLIETFGEAYALYGLAP